MGQKTIQLCRKEKEDRDLFDFTLPFSRGRKSTGRQTRNGKETELMTRTEGSTRFISSGFRYCRRNIKEHSGNRVVVRERKRGIGLCERRTMKHWTIVQEMGRW